MEERDSPRSRSRDRDDQSYDEERPEREDNLRHATVVDNNENFNLYITNLSFETTDEILRAAFEPFGTVDHASVIKQPVTKISRGFGFVLMSNVEETQRALDGMNGAEINGRAIRVEKARRNNGYDKTPGVYMGPAKLSAKYREREPRERDRSRSRGRERDRDRDRPRSRSRSWDRGQGGWDRRDREHDRYLRGPPMPLPFDPRFPDPRYDYRPRYDMRDVRSRGGPLPFPPGPYPSRSPPRFDPRRDRSPPAFDRSYAQGFYRAPAPRY